jgi:hypothetical protein
MSQFKVVWQDHKREPQCPPNPAHPTGIDLSCAGDAKRTCKVDLPYPARRCGIYLVKCDVCGYSIAATTAGRADDPRSVTLPCQIKGEA